MMKVFVSAYACESNKGSEPEVGFNWLVNYLDEGAEVTLLTRSNNQMSIEPLREIYGKNLDVIYYDLPSIFLYIKRRLGLTNLYYLIWQLTFFRNLPIEKLREEFDVVHHVTFVSFRFFSGLHRLKGSLVIGPVAGLETTPKNLLHYLSIQELCREYSRCFINKIFLLTLSRNKTFTKASHIFCTSGESRIKEIFPDKKILTELAIPTHCFLPINKLPQFRKEIMFVGNGIGIKGVNLLPGIMKRLSSNEYSIHIYGDFSKRKREELTCHFRDSNVNFRFHGKLEQGSLFEAMRQYHILLAPFFRDSGAMVVAEGLKNGMIPLCFANGGPKKVLENIPELLVSTSLSKERTEENFAKLIRDLTTDEEFSLNIRSKLEACTVTADPYSKIRLLIGDE